MSEVLNRCVTIFSRLDWDVSVDEVYKLRKDSKPLKPSFILRHNGKIYGFVEVIEKGNISQESLKKTMELSDRIIKHIKPIIFVLTNGYAFEVYHKGKSFGTLTVPPSPDNVNILLGL